MSLLWPLAALWTCGALLLGLSGAPGGSRASRLAGAAEALGLGAAAGYAVFLCGVWIRPADASWLAAAPLLAGAAWLRWRPRPPVGGSIGAAPEPWTRAEIALAAAVACVVCAGAALLFASPLLDWDSRIIWALKAKILAAERTVVSDTFRDPYRLHVHPRYPLLVPWLASLPSQVAGGFSELHFKAVAGLAAALGVAQLYRLARAGGSRRAALVTALAMVLTAGWLRCLEAASVELVLTLYALLSVQALWRWMERRRAADLALAALCLFGASSVKNEGLILGLCLVASLALVLALAGSEARSQLPLLLGLLALWCALLAPWWLHLRLIPSVSDENYLARLRPELLLAALPRLPQLLRETLVRALDPLTWHLTWPAFALACGWAWRRGRLRRDPRAQLLALTCLLYASALAAIYLISPWRDLAQHVDASLDRLLLPLLPLALLLLQRTFAASGGPRREGHERPAPAGGGGAE